MLANSHTPFGISSSWKSSSHFKVSFFHPCACNAQECNSTCPSICPFSGHRVHFPHHGLEHPRSVFSKPEIQFLVLMQLFSSHGSGITLSLCNSAKISREEATGCPFTKRGIILRAQEDIASREGGTFQTEKHCEGIGQRAKMCSTSSRQNVQVTHRQGGSAVLAAFLSKPFFFPHHQPLFFSLSHTVLPFPPPYFPQQCPFSCCFLFPVSAIPT